jgi:hypothetical protein
VYKQAAGTIKLQTSNNGTDWTDQDTTTGVIKITLLANEVTAKYVRIAYVLTAQSNDVRTYLIEGVI